MSRSITGAWLAAAAIAAAATLGSTIYRQAERDSAPPAGVVNPVVGTSHWDRGRWVSTGAVPAAPVEPADDRDDRLFGP